MNNETPSFCRETKDHSVETKTGHFWHLHWVRHCRTRVFSRVFQCIPVHVLTSKLRLMAIGHGIHPNRHQPSDYYPVASSWASDKLEQKKKCGKAPKLRWGCACPSGIHTARAVGLAPCCAIRSASCTSPGWSITHLIVAAVKEKSSISCSEATLTDDRRRMSPWRRSALCQGTKER